MPPTDTSDRDRNDQGRFDDGIAPETVLDVFDAREDRAEPITASDVVDELGIARRTAHNKLNRLVERDTLATRKIGARGRVWWIPIPREDPDGFDTDDLRGDPETTLDDTDTESGHTRGVTPSDGPDDQRPGLSTDGRTSPEYPAEESDAPDPIGDALDRWEPDTQANPRTARAQTRRVAEHLRSVGEYRRKTELVDALAGDSTLGERSWWERAVRPGLGRLADRDLVEYTRNRGWRWIGHLDRDAPEQEEPTE
jgi:hypothetical protein